MLTWKGALYGFTLASAFFCAFRHQQIRTALTDDAVANMSKPGGFYFLSELRKQNARERHLATLTRDELRHYRTFGVAQFILLLILALEVLALQ